MSVAMQTEYARRIAAGALQPDAAQQQALAALGQLAVALAAPAPRRFWGRPAPIPRGIYLHGPVGRGKSMLMDLFFSHVAVPCKRRVHFHAFMQEIHAALHEWRRTPQHGDDPLPQLAQRIARDYRLLCFDEFYVQDIADAMILARLFGALFAAGVVLVATSNCAPEDLYANGLQRASFLPFIALLRMQVTVIEVAGAVDHRLEFLRQRQVFFTPLSPATQNALQDIFAQLTNHAPPMPVILTIQGRDVGFARAAHGVLWSSFAELCERALGPADYLAVARQFHTLVLGGVPQFRADQRNETMRFITLIDALYEAKTKLVLGAQVPPEALYPQGLHALLFQRTASRLQEMQSEAYLSLPHQETMKIS